MFLKKTFFLFFILVFFFSCSNEKKKVDTILDNVDQETQMVEAYREGLEAIKKGDVIFAAKKFNEAEILYPQSVWASKSSLMTSFAYYSQNYYEDAIYNLERHLRNYPKDKNLDYVHYLMGMCYFEQLDDEKKDLRPLVKSRQEFEYVIKHYPNTDFAIDAKYKLSLIVDMLAAKEMHIGRYYLKTKKWAGAINRFQNVVENYDQTVYIEEALHRLIEINYKIGLVDEAEKIASVLGYNYGSGEWYKNSYKVFNKSYKIKKIDKKKEESFIKKKFKSLFE